MTNRGRKRHIIIIEDNPKHLPVFEEMLGDIGGAQLYTAMTIDEARNKVAKIGRKLDCIVLDLRLPDDPSSQLLSGIKGVDLLAVWRKSHRRIKDVPAVIVTARQEDFYAKVVQHHNMEEIQPFVIIEKLEYDNDLLSATEIRRVFKALLLSHVSHCIDAFHLQQEIMKLKNAQDGKRINWRRRKPIDVAVFAALEEEAVIISEAFNLDYKSGDHEWRGKYKALTMVLYRPRAMGRVHAALATQHFLTRYKPKLLLVVGIAGGFKESGVELGHVLVPNKVVDFSFRKVYDFIKVESVQYQQGEEYRLDSFDTDQDIMNLITHKLDHSEWQVKTRHEGAWPSGLTPECHSGKPIASLDEIVVSKTRRRQLLTRWPKLLGVEMEAGGVFAGVRASGESLRVSVIRGVSDSADPIKSKTTDWRRRAMISVKNLLNLLFECEDFKKMM